ncbi:hypothetical protein OAF54_01810 [bacterium]|nr:hypothetical protein [bacterium]
MANFLQFDPAGQFQKSRRNQLAIEGEEFRQQQVRESQPLRNKLLDLQVQGAEQGLGRQGVLAGRQDTQFDQSQALQRAKILNQSARALKGLDPSQYAGALSRLEPMLEQVGIPAGTFTADQITPQTLDETIAATQGFTDDPKQLNALQQAQAGKARAETRKIKAETEVIQQAPDVTEQLNVLTQSLQPETANKAQAAFNLAGGGSKGVKAIAEVIKTSSEQEQRAAVPLMLESRFPEATPEEMTQLQAVADSAKTPESGFKEAAELRENQRRAKDFKVYKARTVELLDRILANPELDDVVGSVEGTDKGFFFGSQSHSDGEAEAIADIEEASNILTTENLKLMSGVLSESDIKLLANLAGGALNRTRGEEAFKGDVTALRDKLNGVAPQSKVNDLVNKYAD